MSKAMNGKNFERQLSAAAIKLSRASEGFDPESGFSKEAIVNFIIELPDLGNEEQIEKAKAVLRHNGELKAAESFAV